MSRRRAKSYPEEVAIVREVVVDGLTPEAAGYKHGVHRQTVVRYLRARGYRPERMGRSPKWEKAT